MNNALSEFNALLSGPYENWDVFEIALQLCRTTRPSLDFEPARDFVRAIAEQVLHNLEAGGDSFQFIDAINHVLYEDYGFRGNEQDYYNPANCYITEVLRQRKGIPITLCILYYEISKRVGLEVEPVAMPGHFLLKHRMPYRDIFIDAFHRGRILLEDGCRNLVEEAYGNELPFKREFLDGVSNDVVVLRMLSNLKKIYRSREDRRLLLEILERRIPLLEDPSIEILERGLLRLDMEYFGSALEDLEDFLRRSGNQELKRLIEEKLEEVRRLARTN